MSRGASLAVDVGGTFTDVVLVDASGQLHLGKCLTTPRDPTEGILSGVREILERTGTAANAVERVAHATTLATNVILERKGAPVAFVTTRGFRSMLTLGRAARVESQRFDLLFDVPEPPVPASHCFEVPERIGAGGVVFEPLDEVAAAEVVEQIAALDVAGVAICFLHAYAQDTHERRMSELLRDRLPGTTIVASSEVWPELREYERATTTLMSAYVGPVMERYLSGLADRFAAIGVRAPVHIMESSGGLMSAALASRRAVHTIESGPAAGVMSVVEIGRALERPNLLSFDMGGTTAKAGIIRAGRAEITHSFHVGGSGSFGGRREGTGLPVKVPAIDLAEVGAGGGSIAWVDDGGAIRVGPHSAGADPGPACYGLGGKEPTVTDADLILGYLDPRTFAGGQLPLSPKLAHAAFEQALCAPLAVPIESAAQAVHDIANAHMGSAVHVVTVQRGIDPRGFALVALGGAGPAHAARVAEGFGIDEVIIPLGCGVGSAIGLLSTDRVTERARTRPMRASQAIPDEIEAVFVELGQAGLGDLEAQPEEARLERSIDARYLGQSHELTIETPPGAPDPDWIESLSARFRARYTQTYGTTPEGEIELVGFRVRVVVPVPRPKLQPPHASSTSSARATRPAYFPERQGFVDTPVFERPSLQVGRLLAGPLIVEESESTIVVPPGWTATPRSDGNLLLQRAEDAG